MTNGFSILVIDDEAQISKLLEISLEANGYKVLFAADGKEGMAMAASYRPDLILLDLGLPDEDGQVILKKLREWFLGPIIILSVKSSEEEIVMALDNSANDYLTKPFRTQELLARIRTGLRSGVSATPNPEIFFGDCVVNLASRTVKCKGAILKFTATEYNLLALLIKNDGRVLTHQYILKEIWGTSYADQTQYLRVFVAQLRKKIEQDANRPKFIVTESGVGYRFNSG